MNTKEFHERFPDEASCRHYWRNKRELAGIVCKRCEGTDHYWHGGKLEWRCKECKSSTSLRSGTVMQDSNLPFLIWFTAMFEMIYRNKVISPAACERMMRCLGRNFWDAEALSQIPPYIEVFSKNGAVNASRSEVLLVNAIHNPYIFSIFTKNNKDISWGDTKEAWILTRKISGILWEYFEPKDKWEPGLK
jgi:hypothetical protein